MRFRPNGGEAVQQSHSHRGRNLLLNALTPSDFELLAPHLTSVRLEPRKVLGAANEPIEHVYFPESGIASVVSHMPKSGSTEVGIFGRDGMSGTSLLVGSDRSPHETFIQVGNGTALRIDAARFGDATVRSRSLHLTLLRFLQTSIVQTAHTAVSNAHHPVEARLARWLLMCHDRIDNDEIALTHEFMSMMICARRTGVTVTLHVLEGAGMILSRRGRVIIVDRAKLENFAGEAYGPPEAEYRRLLGPFGRAPQ